MPVEGFDDASKNISKKGSSRRKASRDAYSKKLQEKGAAREARKAKAKAAQNEFNKYATPGQKRKAARNSSVNKADVIAKGKKKELDYFAGESDKAVKRDADKKAAKAKADGNITKTVTPKTKAKVVAPKAKVVAPKAKPASTKTTTTKPPAETKLVNAPGAYTKPNEFKKSVSTVTSAAAPKKPRTSSDKAANRKYQKEMSAYNRQNQTLTKRKQAKRETEAMVTRAKGISATILGDDVRANKLVRKEAKIKGKIAKTNKKMSGAVEEKTKKGTYDFKKGIKVSMFNR